MINSKKDPDWQFDDQCPECGEDVYLAAIVEPMKHGETERKATIMCGEGEDRGCGHTWKNCVEVEI